ncbi:ATP-binding cassette subfamily C protein [Metabacillus crassostreae]|uniref:ABC transporter ATP-binding protein n=1 Tax=Metabacillus crassostreae TaxID=929098 RepID=UPI00195E1536|nr:ABC transporter ATP-binding protein [Metabacillus crassostreae]MBM7604631.1 ATP-binding cassette subfamily C protein [Metabacillus crassostreae]
MVHIVYFLKQIHSYKGKKLYFNLIASLIISVLDGVGILLLIPLISLTGLVNFNSEPIPFLQLFNFIDYIPTSFVLPVILGIYVILVVSQAYLQRHITIQNAKIHHGFLRYLRIKTYRDIIYADWDFFIKNRKSDLINIVTTEVNRSSAGTNALLQFLTSLIFTCFQIGLAFILSPSITIFLLICGLAIIFLNRQFLKKSMALGKRNYTLGKEFLGGITDQFNGIKDIKSNTLEESRLSWYDKLTDKMKDEQIEYTKMKSSSQLYYKVASSILIALFIFIAISMFNAQAAQLMLIIIIFSRLWPRVAGIQSSMEQIATTIPSFKAVIKMQKESKEALEFQENEYQEVKSLQVNKELECQNVYFRYHKNASSPFTLKDINIVIPANKMTAIVGRSGAGKSTLIDLLMGLNKPEEGQIIVDGKPLSRGDLFSLRKAMSYVPQDPFLFNTSIRENLSLVVPKATDKMLWEALEFSSASEFVKKLPQGLDTIIGDRGIRLSGGERQRIVLARAILRSPSILILDEATSALDSENEEKIQQAIERLQGKMTIIVIAHRLSTIRNADQVVVLDQGSVIQKGEYGSLASDKKNLFGNLLTRQMDITFEKAD